MNNVWLILKGNHMKKFKVTAMETIFYEKIVEAENKDEAYNTFVETACEEDVIDSANFEVDGIDEVIDDE
jgi:hypothetical protein